jgi:hypothetical protein
MTILGSLPEGMRCSIAGLMLLGNGGLMMDL